MSRNAKRIRISIVNPPSGCRDTTSLEHARRYVKRETAEWAMYGVSIRFIHRRKHQAHTPTVDVVEQYATITDSGFVGFLRYPMPLMHSGARFPALASAGAGL